MRRDRHWRCMEGSPSLNANAVQRARVSLASARRAGLQRPMVRSLPTITFRSLTRCYPTHAV